MGQPVPVVDLVDDPIQAARARVEAGAGDHSMCRRTICEAVAAALGLPAGVALSEHDNHATLATCSVPGGVAVEYRSRVDGVLFGKGSHKATGYLGMSSVGLSNTHDVVSWSEDVLRFTAAATHRKAVNAGKPPRLGSLRDCRLLTFVRGGQAIPISRELRSLIARVALPPASSRRPGRAHRRRRPRRRRRPHGRNAVPIVAATKRRGALRR